MVRPMVIKNFRVPQQLWDDAKAVAAEQGEDVSDILRDALTAYVEQGKR